MGGASASVAGGAKTTGTTGTTGTTLQVNQRTVLDPQAVAAALAIRSEETVERSTQREQLGKSVLDAEARRLQADQASLDALASDRLVRFADAPIVWSMPVQGYVLTSLYGPRWGGTHTGLDMAAPSGTPIYAMAGGEIISAKYESGFGNKTVIRHEDGTETWYCHQSGFEVTSGTVKGGDLIGYVGSTGNSTGPHLHLEVHPMGGGPINPLSWMRALGLKI
jgi:murein DD-endopeptidase MepM/ murein hydrolase activator NlpD